MLHQEGKVELAADDQEPGPFEDFYHKLIALSQEARALGLKGFSWDARSQLPLTEVRGLQFQISAGRSLFRVRTAIGGLTKRQNMLPQQD